jgi:hypothetical protein
MKKYGVLLVALAIQGGTMQGFSFNSLKQDLQEGMNKLKQTYQATKDYVQNQVLNPFDTKVMVFNIAESYVVVAGGVTINPGAVQWVSARRNGGTFNITAKNKSSGSNAGEAISYTRVPTEDVIEVDVGRAPAFPKIVDRSTGKELVQKQSWLGGSVSASVKIWTRALSLTQAQNGYNISY